MKKNILYLKNIYSKNKTIVENYFFMTILQILNSFFYILIYPFLIRSLGGESYGLFVFCTSIVTYFIFLINFGFDFPAVKHASTNIEDKKELGELLSNILTSKIILFFLSLVFLLISANFINFLKSNLTLILICFSQALYHVLLPQWFFQARQNMRIVTYIQLGVKIVSLPVIFYLIRDKSDLNVYALIVSCSSIFSAIILFNIIILKYKINIKISNIFEIKKWFHEGFPFFLSNSAGVLKEQSIIIIIGSFFGMREVAVYDLANKIISIPKTLMTSINAAIFPVLVKEYNAIKIKKIIKIEFLLSFGVIFATVLFGNIIVQILGGKEMQMAYPLAILLSLTVMVWLVVGAYISFVFVPKDKYFFVTKNQIIALFSFAFFSLVGLLLIKDILVLGGAIALSGICEILYCKWVVYKLKLL